MQVFISWSKDRSKSLAQALADWIPDVLQCAEPWMSEADIVKGKRWSDEVAQQLSASGFGIICLTPENITEPWVSFEAGAISKTLDQGASFVCPYLLGLKNTDVSGPLAQFQMTLSTEAETFRLMKSMNTAAGSEGVDETRLDRAFKRNWPDLEKTIDRLKRNVPTTANAMQQRNSSDLLEEILTRVRDIQRDRLGISSRRPITDHNILQQQERFADVRLHEITRLYRDAVRRIKTLRLQIDPTKLSTHEIHELRDKLDTAQKDADVLARERDVILQERATLLANTSS